KSIPCGLVSIRVDGVWTESTYSACFGGIRGNLGILRSVRIRVRRGFRAGVPFRAGAVILVGHGRKVLGSWRKVLWGRRRILPWCRLVAGKGLVPGFGGGGCGIAAALNGNRIPVGVG